MRKAVHTASGAENQTLFFPDPAAERIDFDLNCSGKHARRNTKLIGCRTAVYASPVRKAVLL